MKFRRATVEISDSRSRHSPLPSGAPRIDIHDLERIVSTDAIRAS